MYHTMSVQFNIYLLPPIVMSDNNSSSVLVAIVAIVAIIFIGLYVVRVIQSEQDSALPDSINVQIPGGSGDE